MKAKMLKDTKMMIGFTLALVLEGIAIILASYDNDYWVFFLFLGILLTAISAHRAAQVYKQQT